MLSMRLGPREMRRSDWKGRQPWHPSAWLSNDQTSPNSPKILTVHEINQSDLQRRSMMFRCVRLDFDVSRVGDVTTRTKKTIAHPTPNTTPNAASFYPMCRDPGHPGSKLLQAGGSGLSVIHLDLLKHQWHRVVQLEVSKSCYPSIIINNHPYF